MKPKQKEITEDGRETNGSEKPEAVIENGAFQIPGYEDRAGKEMEVKMVDTTVDEFLARRKEAALNIDPETAEVDWSWGQILDPYGVQDVPDEAQCTGRIYFARARGGDTWVSFDDLPAERRKRLWERLPQALVDQWPFDDAFIVEKGASSESAE